MSINLKKLPYVKTPKIYKVQFYVFITIVMKRILSFN